MKRLRDTLHELRIVIGLGNPGATYQSHRHNAGAMVVRTAARDWGIPLRRSVGDAAVGMGVFGGRPVVLGIPRIFMNASGRAVKGILRRWPVPLEQLLIVCDDVALPFGTVRLKPTGSDGGHRGLRSIIEELGSTAFARLRVGIGVVPRPEALDQFVLAPFTVAQQRQWPQIVAAAVGACALWARAGMDAAMNRYNRKVRRQGNGGAR